MPCSLPACINQWLCLYASIGAPGGGYTKSRGLLPHTARDLQHGLPLDVDNIVKPRRIYKANPLSHSVVPITSSPIMPRSNSQAQLRRSPPLPSSHLSRSHGGSPQHTMTLLSSGQGSRSTSSLPLPRARLVTATTYTPTNLSNNRSTC
jgi:hypothetical protein